MGKRAQQKRAWKETDTMSKNRFAWVSSMLHWEQFRHPHFWVAILAFALVVGYPLVTGTTWYKQHVSKLSGEELAVETANEAVITTDKGQITFQFERKDAPKTSENFIRLASRGYYTNVTFHRVEEGFVIQGGDPKGDGTGGESAWGGTFQDEINPDSPLYQRGYVEGTVAMANAGPNTNGSQFFITLADQPSLPKSYTIFGHVTAGIDVVKKIARGDKMVKVEVR